MLHGTLPRAFVSPGIKYLAGGYGYGDDGSGYAAAYAGTSSFEAEQYSVIPDQHHHAFPTWHTVQRPASPSPLDLSLKPSPGRAEMSTIDHEPEVNLRREQTVVTEGFEPESSGYSPPRVPTTPQHHLQGISAPMTPPSTPSPPQCPRKRPREDPGSGGSPALALHGDKGEKGEKGGPQRSKKKHARRLKFDEDTSSPVSGTVILGPDEAVVTGDIDPAFNVVEVTVEARAELAKIENRLGPYQCRLCRQLHGDAFQLAQHRCSRIAHVEYRCPECDKRFSCPANLASHRRWHKPRTSNLQPDGPSNQPASIGAEFACSNCDAKFGRQAALRKHLAAQHPESAAPAPAASGTNGAHLAVSALTCEAP
ncbi:insulinoma-associated protein 1a [Neodiprion pinetum]|uniref:insulinoma-associated protein 1a n=1 Tax=Neodiprion pinetum TaxID=441929 RepID=UPI00076FACE6|nr:insulinoma-associated protein 1a-like [Neodiprion pinetum]